jgi:kynurenine formamidase
MAGSPARLAPPGYPRAMIIDLSHEIAAGMVTYPGLVGPRLEVMT